MKGLASMERPQEFDYLSKADLTMDAATQYTLGYTAAKAYYKKKESILVLEECIELQTKKSQDYQNPNSTVSQSDYYPSGLFTIHEIVHAKMLRMRSVMEAMRDDPNYDANFESLEDSAKDAINYLSFLVSYCRGEMEGQDKDKDGVFK